MSEFTDEQIQDAMEEMDLDKSEDTEDDRVLSNDEWQEGFGPPEPEERQNAHSFLHKAAFDSPNTLKTTFLTEAELGRPDFTARFLLSIKTVAEDLIDPLCEELKEHKLTNGISNYFGEKVENITSSGLSNRGFAMNMNVTRKMDARRERVKNLEPESKGRPRL